MVTLYLPVRPQYWPGAETPEEARACAKFAQETLDTRYKDEGLEARVELSEGYQLADLDWTDTEAYKTFLQADYHLALLRREDIQRTAYDKRAELIGKHKAEIKEKARDRLGLPNVQKVKRKRKMSIPKMPRRITKTKDTSSDDEDKQPTTPALLPSL